MIFRSGGHTLIRKFFLIQAQQSLDLIEEELSKVTDSTDELIENSSLTSQTVRFPARF